MNQPHIEGNLYCPDTNTLAEALNKYGSARWNKSYHRDRNEMKTDSETLARPFYRLASKGKSGAKPATSAGPHEPVPCLLERR